MQIKAVARLGLELEAKNQLSAVSGCGPQKSNLRRFSEIRWREILPLEQAEAGVTGDPMGSAGDRGLLSNRRLD